jgi:trans-2,3-dihydro-3-hydroxyanthranilate isomerase
MSRLSRRSLLSAAALGFVPALAPGAAQPMRRPAVVNGRRFLQYDVFTERPLSGNQLAVFFDTSGLEASHMHAMTRETRFSECTFVFPPEAAGTDVRVRIFGPGGEMPFAGHPVIGTAFALVDEGRIPAGTREVTFGLGLGPTLVELEWRGEQLAFAWMTQQPPRFGPIVEARAQLAAAIGVDASALRPNAPIQEVNCGSSFFMVPLASRAAVDRAAIDTRAVEAVFKSAGIQRRGLFIFAAGPSGDGATAYSRMLGAASEDPATGSASGPLGAYLVKHGIVPVSQAGSIVSAQGVKMGRPSRIHIRIDASSPDHITRVRVGGASVLVGEGRLRAM